MATIRERNGRFHVQVRMKDHPTVTKSFRRKSDAKQWARETEADIGRGKRFEREKHTLAEALDRFMENPERTLRKYQKAVLNWWRDEAQTRKGLKLGTMELGKLRRAYFIEAREQLQGLPSRQGESLKPATINRRLSAVSAVLTKAMEWDWIATNPARIKRLTEDNERDRLLTPDEQKKLLVACKASDEPHMYAFAVCAMSSGARAGELIGLRWCDVDLEQGVARLLDTKNGTNRAVPIRGHALDLLKEIKKSETVTEIHGDNFVFKNKTGFAPFYYRKAWQEVVTAAKLDDFRFHDLRHLAASYLAMAGTSQRELMELLGHKSAAMTRRYSHFFDEHVADLGDRLNDRLFGKAGE